MKRSSELAAIFLLFVASLVPLRAQAHTAWFVPTQAPFPGAKGAAFLVEFGGHEGKLEPYPARKVGEILAMNEDSEVLPVWRLEADSAFKIWVEGAPAVLTMSFDNGIYTRTADGESVNAPMDAVTDAISGVRALKYHKTIAKWTPLATSARGQAFEVIPLSGDAPTAGTPMQVKVLIDGVPAPDIEIGTGENTHQSKTNARGIAAYVPTPGFNKLWAGKRTKVTGDPRFTELSIEYLLTFRADED